MSIKLTLFLILFFPASIFAQTSSDSDFDKIVERDCDGKRFTKTEVLPSLKISNEAYEDSLMLYLRSKNVIIKNSLAPFRFFLTSNSQILGIRLGINKPSPDMWILRDAILHFGDLWKPAVQNSHIVCAYVTVMIVFKGDKIDVDILQ